MRVDLVRVDLVRVDLAAIDPVRSDLVKGSCSHQLSHWTSGIEQMR